MTVGGRMAVNVHAVQCTQYNNLFLKTRFYWYTFKAVYAVKNPLF